MQRPDYFVPHQAIGCCSSSGGGDGGPCPNKAALPLSPSLSPSLSSSSSSCAAFAALDEMTAVYHRLQDHASYFQQQVWSISRLNQDAIRLFQVGRLDEASQLFCQALQQLPTAEGLGSTTSSTISMTERRRRDFELHRLGAAIMPTISITTTSAGVLIRRHHHHNQQKHDQHQRPQYSFTRREYDEGMQVFSACVHIDTTTLLVQSSSSHTNVQDTINYMAAILLFNNGLTHLALCASSCSNDSSSSSSSNGISPSTSLILAMECFLQAVHVARYTPPPHNTNSISGQHIIIASLHNIGYIQFLYHGDILQAIDTFHEALHECHHFDDIDDMDNDDESSSYSSSSLCCSSDNQHHLHNHYLAATLNCLGVLYYHLPRCQTTKALEYLQRALSIQRHHTTSASAATTTTTTASAAAVTALGSSPIVLLATTLNNIGRVLYMDGKFDQAMLAYREALDIRRVILGNMHLDVAATIYNIGQTHHHTGNLHEALEHYQEFMFITVPQLGYCHRDVATILKCMAQIHQHGKQYHQALCLFHQALCAARGSAAAAALSGGGGGGSLMHNDASGVLVASICNKIGNLYYEMRDYQHAITMYQQGLEIERVVLDAHHPNIAVTLSNIGQIYKECGDLNAAALVYQQVLDLQLQTLPRNDACLAITYSNLGLIHYQNRNHLAALEMYQEALRIRRQVYGDNEENLEVAATLNSIGLVLFKLGLFELAIQSFSEGLRMRRQVLGDFHRDVAIILYNIATVHSELGAEDEAMDCYQQALQVEIKALGPDDLDLLLTLRHILQVHQQRGEIAEAIDCCWEILRIQKVHSYHLPTNDNVASAADMVQTYNCLANLRLQMGDGAGVVEALTEATRLARSAGLLGDDRTHGNARIHLIGFHLYGISKLHPEAAAAA